MIVDPVRIEGPSLETLPRPSDFGLGLPGWGRFLERFPGRGTNQFAPILAARRKHQDPASAFPLEPFFLVWRYSRRRAGGTLDASSGQSKRRRWPTEAALPRRLQLALKPAHDLIGFDRIGQVAFKALEHARSLPVGGCRHQNQICPALGASRSFRLTHEIILPPIRNVVHFKVGAFLRMNTLRSSARVGRIQLGAAGALGLR